METLLKSPRQEEFSALMHTMEELGYRAADVARLLNKTHGAVSQYLSGKTHPSETVLDLFRRVVAEKKGVPETVEIGGKTLKEQLADLKRFSPADYEVAKTTITLLHRKLPTEINSKATAAATRMLKKGAASVRKHGPK